MKFHQGFNTLENVKTVIFVILLVLACVAVWLVLSLIAGQTIYREVGYHNVPILPTRLIGSH